MAEAQAWEYKLIEVQDWLADKDVLLTSHLEQELTVDDLPDESQVRERYPSTNSIRCVTSTREIAPPLHHVVRENFAPKTTATPVLKHTRNDCSPECCMPKSATCARFYRIFRTFLLLYINTADPSFQFHYTL